MRTSKGEISMVDTHMLQGFPKKTPEFLKFGNTPDLLRDISTSKIMDKIKGKHLSNRASFMGNPVSLRNKLLSS